MRTLNSAINLGLKAVTVLGMVLSSTPAFSQEAAAPAAAGEATAAQYTPIEKIPEVGYTQCAVILTTASGQKDDSEGYKKIEMATATNSQVERFGRQKYVFAARGEGNTEATAAYEVDLIVQFMNNSNWVRTNDLGVNVKMLTTVYRIMNGQRTAVARHIETTDTVSNISQLSQASQNEIIRTGVFVSNPELTDYFNPDSEKNLLVDQDIELSFRNSGFEAAFDAAINKRKIPSDTVLGMSVLCEARLRAAPLGTSEQIIKSGGGAVCQGLIDRDQQLQDLDGLNVLKRMLGQ